MNTVAQLLEAKPSGNTYTVNPTTTVYDALKLMSEKNIGALVVTEGERVAGIFSERDYARKIILMGKSSRETEVREIMTANVFSIKSRQSIGECMSVMTDKHIRHLPVIDDGKLTGVISIGDVVKAIISEQEDTIHHLEGYITGKR
ncbi:MAG TPA: CBS domain-containing protein [Bacteroidota bacterium]|jgi:CBS domain-containing protein